MPDSCLGCGRRADCVFCDLTPEALVAFDGIKTFETFPKGFILFREGQPARGVFLICQGRIRLSVNSEAGHRLVVRIVSVGEALGMSATLAGAGYEVTAEAIDSVVVTYVRRKELLHFLRHHCDVCMQVVNQLSEDLHLAYGWVRRIGLGRNRRAAAAQVH